MTIIYHDMSCYDRPSGIWALTNCSRKSELSETCSRLEQFPGGSGGRWMSSSLMLTGDCDVVCTVDKNAVSHYHAVLCKLILLGGLFG